MDPCRRTAFRFCLSCIVPLVLSGCDKKSGDDRGNHASSNTVASNGSSPPGSTEEPENITADEFNALLGGDKWATDCILQESNAAIVYEYRTIQFKDNKAIVSFDKFYDPRCQEGIFTTIYTSSYSLGKFADYLNVPTGFEIDYVYLSAQLIQHNQAQLDSYNDLGAYGYTDWVLNEPKDITGRAFGTTSTDAVAAAGELDYDVIAIADGYMTIGLTESGDGKSTVTRPKELLPNVIFRRN
ncbi:MAG: hypothetical protein AB7T49_14600 [Oligoflexales bacterium]